MIEIFFRVWFQKVKVNLQGSKIPSPLVSNLSLPRMKKMQIVGKLKPHHVDGSLNFLFYSKVMHERVKLGSYQTLTT